MPVKFRDDWFKIKYTYKTIVFGYWTSTVVSLPPSLVIMASNLSKFGERGGGDFSYFARLLQSWDFILCPPIFSVKGTFHIVPLSLVLRDSIFYPPPSLSKLGDVSYCVASPSHLLSWGLFPLYLPPSFKVERLFPTFSVKGTFHIVPLPSVFGDSIFLPLPPPHPGYTFWAAAPQATYN